MEFKKNLSSELSLYILKELLGITVYKGNLCHGDLKCRNSWKYFLFKSKGKSSYSRFTLARFWWQIMQCIVTHILAP